MRRLLLATVLSLAATFPASACLNDVTIKGSEREFRSQYETPPPASTPPSGTDSYTQAMLLRGLGGTALLVVAVVLTFRRSPAA